MNNPNATAAPFERMECVKYSREGTLTIECSMLQRAIKNFDTKTWRDEEFFHFKDHVMELARNYGDPKFTGSVTFEKPLVTQTGGKMNETLVHFQAKIMGGKEVTDDGYTKYVRTTN